MRIVDVEARTVRWPIVSSGAARGRSERAAVIVIVHDETGAVGVGEAAPLSGMSIDTIDDALYAVTALAARVPFLLATPKHASAIADRVTTAPAARFAIETALLSAFAQRTRTSVASLLCAMPQGELRNAVVVDDEDEAQAAVALGARRLKIKVGHSSIADDLQRIHRIARAVPGMHVRLDANRGWPRERVPAIFAELAHAADGLRIEYVEEPCRDAHTLLETDLSFRIALDDSLVDLDRATLDRALCSPHLAALVLKPTLLGGFARCLELATLAHQHGVAPVVTHALEGPIGTAACIELARAIGADVPVGLARHPALAGFSEAA